MSLIEYSKAYKPFKYPSLVERAVAHDKLTWGEWESDLSDDVRQWKTGEINEAEKYHITSILKLFTQSDVVVGGSYVDVFLQQIKNNEARMMLLSFAQRESIHQRAYALLNDTLGLDEQEYSSFLAIKEMAEKVEFMSDFSNGDLAKKIAQTICNEGMSLFSAFVMLLNYQRMGKMRGMCEIVEWSIRDETLHVEGMTELFKIYCKENRKVVTDDLKKSIYEMYTRAVELEDAVIDNAYNDCDIKGLGKDEVKTYIRYLADRRLIQLGLKGIFKVKENPLPWLDVIINGDSHKNFFEGRVTDYSADGMKGEWGW